jgi:cell division transport system permease protein
VHQISEGTPEPIGVGRPIKHAFIFEGHHEDLMFFLRYFFRRTLQNIRGNLLLNLGTISVIAISMLIFSAFSLIAFNLTSILKVWEDKIEIIAYLKRRPAPGDLDVLLKNVGLLHGVERVKYISSFEAMSFMETKLGSQRNLLEGVQPDVLPPSLEIQLAKEYRNSVRIKEVVSQLRQFSQIEEIQYGKEWVETFSGLLHVVRVTQWILGGLLIAAMTFIIANTVQLTISSRREEIGVMHLVGASPAFIQVPFYIEGLVQGLLGAQLAIVLLFLLYKLFFIYIPLPVKESLEKVPIAFMPPETIVWFLSGGMVLGFFGSLVASIKILKYSG